jgi:hypothetical protein
VRRSPTRNHTTTGAEELSAGREEELCAISLEAFLREMRADRVRIPVPTIFPDAFRNRTSADERRTGWMSRGSAPRRPRAVAAGATSAHRADAVHEAISAGGRRRRGERSPAPTNDSWQRGFSGKSPAKNFPRTPRHVRPHPVSPHADARPRAHRRVDPSCRCSQCQHTRFRQRRRGARRRRRHRRRPRRL